MQKNELQKEAEIIIAMMADARENNVKNRYDIAQYIVRVLNNAQYGDNVANRLTQYMGWKLQWLYAYAKIAQRWTCIEFSALAEERMANNRALSWSHFNVLAHVGNTRKRDKLIRQTLTNCWTIRELREAIYGVPADEVTVGQLLDFILKDCDNRMRTLEQGTGKSVGCSWLKLGISPDIAQKMKTQKLGRRGKRTVTN